MTKHIAPLPDPDGSLLLRELNHRVSNELTSAICTVSAKAVESDDVAVKAALLDVVDLLHGYADFHKAMRMPEPRHLTDAARYLQHLCFCITKYRLDLLSIRLLFSADDLRLGGERCWKLGLIVSELLTNVARHARFDDRHPEGTVKLLLAGNVVRCAVSDNGSASDLIVRGRGLMIVGELASSLGGRVHASCAAEGSSFLLTFPLTESNVPPAQLRPQNIHLRQFNITESSHFGSSDMKGECLEALERNRAAIPRKELNMQVVSNSGGLFAGER